MYSTPQSHCVDQAQRGSVSSNSKRCNPFLHPRPLLPCYISTLNRFAATLPLCLWDRVYFVANCLLGIRYFHSKFGSRAAPPWWSIKMVSPTRVSLPFRTFWTSSSSRMQLNSHSITWQVTFSISMCVPALSPWYVMYLKISSPNKHQQKTNTFYDNRTKIRKRRKSLFWGLIIITTYVWLL